MLKGSLRLTLRPRGIRSYSVVREDVTKDIREKTISDAVARDEEISAKNKALRELKASTSASISILNKTPSTLINARLAKLQLDLDTLPQTKVKQLDEELEDFMFKNMNLPRKDVAKRPWISSAKPVNNTNSTTVKLGSTAKMSFLNQFPNLVPSPEHRPYSDQELYLRQLAHSRQLGTTGSQLTNIYSARNLVNKPATIQETTIASLLAAGCHLGHSKSMWRPTTQPFIYGEYDGIHLIDLNETISALKRACQVIKGVSRKGGVILFVGTSKNWEQQRSLEEAANRSRGYYVSKRWIPGIITNYMEVTKQIKGEDAKVEVDMLNVPTGRALGEQVLIKPDLVVILNPVENRTCINECLMLRVPTIGLCDTDMEPSLLTYPIPSNDDSVRATGLITGILSKAAEAGLNERLYTVGAFREVNNLRSVAA